MPHFTRVQLTKHEYLVKKLYTQTIVYCVLETRAAEARRLTFTIVDYNVPPRLMLMDGFVMIEKSCNIVQHIPEFV